MKKKKIPSGTLIRSTGAREESITDAKTTKERTKLGNGETLNIANMGAENRGPGKKNETSEKAKAKGPEKKDKAE